MNKLVLKLNELIEKTTYTVSENLRIKKQRKVKITIFQKYLKNFLN